jgi:hypothetical protein
MPNKIINLALCLLVLLAGPSSGFAHVGSPDVYLEGDAGPYHLLVSINPPAMVPGVAQVVVRVISGRVTSMTLVPVYLGTKDKGFPPSPDAMQPVPGDSQSFSGKVWLMASGSWEVRVNAEGPQGAAQMAVPVPAFARRTLPMQKGLDALLLGLMLFLAVGVVAIAAAAAREGVLKPGETPAAPQKWRGRLAAVVAAVLVLGLLALGNWWWNLEAADLKQRMLYTAPPLTAALDGTNQLTLHIGDDSWHRLRKDSWSMNLIPDHGHLVHLFLIRVPALDRFYHLHPELAADGSFHTPLPPMPAGRYQVFADYVRGSGFPETSVAEITLPDIAGLPYAGDDSGVETAAPYSSNVELRSAKIDPHPQPSSLLADSTRMVCLEGCASVKAGQLAWMRFRVEDLQGNPVADLEPYMGMAGHAELVRSDLSVFAHIHPAGSVPMAALAIVQPDSTSSMDHAAMSHADSSSSMPTASGALPPVVSFPYAFPQPGDYRLFIQTKRHGQVQTGVFYVHVAA